MNKHVLISMLSLSILAACGGGGGSDTTSTTPTDPGTPAPTPVTPTDPVEENAVTAKIVSNTSSAEIGTAISLDASASKGDTLTYAWRLTKPDGSTATLTATDTATSSFTPDVVGNYTAHVDITDSAGKTDSASHQVAVSKPIKDDGISIKLQSLAKQSSSNVPFTFAQPFVVGKYPKTQQFALKNAATGELVTLQTDSKASHKDGTLRHAIFSGVLPSIDAEKTVDLDLVAVDTSVNTPKYDLKTLLDSGLDASIELTLENGKLYTLELQKLFKEKPEQLWLDGSLVREWMAFDTFKDKDGNEHPHLAGRMNLRVYGNQDHVQLDTVVENTWTYQENPRNHVYDLKIKINDEVKYEEQNINHVMRGRWRKTLWTGDAPELHIGFDSQYLIDTKLIPSYDPALIGNITDRLLNVYRQKWNDAEVTYAIKNDGNYGVVGEGHNEYRYKFNGPMSGGFAFRAMASVGGRPDIGPLPRWVASYVLNQDPLTRKVAFGMGDLAGSWPMHYRDKATGRMTSIRDHRYIADFWAWKNTLNPETGKYERPVPCELENQALCTANNRPDGAHQPSSNFVPYLLSGDYYHLEEMQFWMNYNFIRQGASWRGYEKGLLEKLQVRERAWSFRTLVHVAYITPDDDYFKSYFTDSVEHNIDNYLDIYINNMPNPYGAVHPYVLPATAPWMDDFFTWSIGNAVDMGHTRLKPLLEWKSRFPVQRMGFGSENAKTFCWIFGSAYGLKIAEGRDGPWYQTMDEVYKNSLGVQKLVTGKIMDDGGHECGSQAMADHLGLKKGEMVDYSHSSHGLPSILQAALATAASAGVDGSQEAWQQFMSRSVKPDYNYYPNWAIVPRKQSADSK